MATKSILKDLTFRDKRLSRSFVNAIERSQNKKTHEVVFTKKVSEIKDIEVIRSILGEL